MTTALMPRRGAPFPALALSPAVSTAATAQDRATEVLLVPDMKAGTLTFVPVD